IGRAAAGPLGAAFPWTAESVREASARAREALARGTPYEPKQFTPHEWETVRVLVDLILPKDERSGSATEAGVPEFMDFMLGDDPDLQTPVRGGLAWLDHECADRYGQTFVACTAAERAAVLADIAWQAKAYRSVAEMVADPAIDALWLCGPNFARIENFEEIADAVTRGKGELRGIACEKPLARNVSEAKRVLELTKKTGIAHGYLENQ